MKRYRKINSDGIVEYYNGKYIKTDEYVICNPTHEMLTEAGYEEYEVPEMPASEPMDRRTPTTSSVLEAMKSMLEPQIAALSDEEAVKVVALFPTWESKVGQLLNVGDRLYYNECLYKVIQSHTASEGWNPKVANSLFSNVTAELLNQSGTIDNPIAWESGMECFAGKYYVEDGVLYRCVRGSELSLYYRISDLVGNYFEVL